MKSLFRQFRIRKLVLSVADAFIIVIAALMSNYLLSLFDTEISARLLTFSSALSVICCFAALLCFGAYTKLWRYFHKKDYLSCVYGTVLGIVVSGLLVYSFVGKLNIAFYAIHLIISVIGICLFRFLFKTTFIDLLESGINDAAYKKTMIIGGGQACRMLLSEISNAQASNNVNERNTAMYRPVCIIDDDISKIGTEVNGVTVVGTTAEIQKYIEQKKVEQIIVAIPSCSEEERQRILDICSATKLPVKVIPFIGSLIFDEDHTKLLDHVRDIRVEDLLGREPVRFDNKQISDFIKDKVCMVTGGGGSIGSELVRQIAKYSPKKIVVIDIYENNAYEIQQELIMDYGDELDFITLIASVRDYDRMNMIFEKYKPQIVFHAAAHKHVPLMEASPMEAIKNNVIGTFNTATLAQFHNVEKFVMISTDKAVNPTNVMGASKRCCEMIVQYLSQQKDGTTEFITTRFGNVLGSNGSVIPLFKKQIEQGKPVTVTHPDIIRYFMTIPEAVSLVMEAAAIAEGGEIFVLDMGQPVRITSLAENLIRMYGKVPYKDVEIKFTGLRPGEKIKEELLMDEEGLQKTSNKLIFIGKQIEIDAEVFEKQLYALNVAAGKNNDQRAIDALHKIVPTFITPEEFNKKVMVNV
ncbi:MAG: polysaccharide biosynthesis protein [Ruminococcus sp.]|nr:polysaccharide biosynthesis protein [Ruminococcus sp.]